MTERPPRRPPRLRNGNRRDETFYCKYGSHYVIPIHFETDERNGGICLDCAFKVQALLGAVTYLRKLGPVEEMRSRKAWAQQMDQDVEREVMRGGSKDPGWIYYVAQADLIKIGYAVDVTKRIKAYGPTAKLLAVHPGTKELEHSMHVRFKEHLDSGREWFSRDQTILDHVAEVVEQFGDAIVFEYRWTKPKSQEEKVRDMFTTRGHNILADGAHSAV